MEKEKNDDKYLKEPIGLKRDDIVKMFAEIINNS